MRILHYDFKSIQIIQSATWLDKQMNTDEKIFFWLRSSKNFDSVYF